jgi:Ca-activated chloride channel homolog
LEKIFFILVFITGFGLILLGQQSSRQTQPEPATSRILFIFDASQSMYSRWQSDTRFNIARKLLLEMVDSLETIDNVQMALRVFGHQKRFPPQDCDDSRLEVPFSRNSAPQIRDKLRRITPRGTTPIALSLQRAANDFPPCQNCRNIIILITDGLEECGGDPCEVSRALQQKGIILKPFIIGIGRDFREEFDCVGHYFDASSEIEFKASLNIIISQVLGKTTSQVNLLDSNGKPTETNLPITFFDNTSGRILDNIMHTMNHRGLPDTLYILDPFVEYNMLVHTTPETWVHNISIVPGKHNIIAADTPTGSLFLTSGGQVPASYHAIIRKKDDTETLKVQYFGNTERYLTGSYDIEILSLPRIHIKDVGIKQNHVTRVEVPQPGIASIRLPALGYAILFVEEDNQLSAIHTLSETQLNQTLYLQPGNYRVVFRSRVSTNTGFTIERKFRITSGSSVSVTLH